MSRGQESLLKEVMPELRPKRSESAGLAGDGVGVDVGMRREGCPGRGYSSGREQAHVKN